MRNAAVFPLALAAVALLLAACGGGQGKTTDGVRKPPQAVNALNSVAQAGSQPPSQTLSNAQFQAILDSIRPPSSEELVARDLNAIDPSWKATSNDITYFVA